MSDWTPSRETTMTMVWNYASRAAWRPGNKEYEDGLIGHIRDAHPHHHGLEFGTDEYDQHFTELQETIEDGFEDGGGERRPWAARLAIHRAWSGWSPASARA